MIILASQSSIRQHILSNAGIKFITQTSPFDEQAEQKHLIAANPQAVSQNLAHAKAHAISLQQPDALVIGADQTLEFENTIVHKSNSIADARRILHRLSGKTHHLHSALAVTTGTNLLYHHIATSTLTMRNLSATYIENYLEQIGDDALTSPGAYQIEKIGAQLFDRIEGDYFSILGLPLLPLLAFFRQIGELPS
jgi:septum formation protein